VPNFWSLILTAETGNKTQKNTKNKKQQKHLTNCQKFFIIIIIITLLQKNKKTKKQNNKNTSGKQEFKAASEAIHRVSPGAQIIPKLVDGYPMEVSIFFLLEKIKNKNAENLESKGKLLWRGPQRRLFRKYRDWRVQSQKDIEAALKQADL